MFNRHVLFVCSYYLSFFYAGICCQYAFKIIRVSRGTVLSERLLVMTISQNWEPSVIWTLLKWVWDELFLWNTLSAQSDSFTLPPAFFFLNAHFELCSLLWCWSPPSCLLSPVSRLSLSLSLARPPLESVSSSFSFSLPLHCFLNIFLQGKHFHLCYGWLFNAVSLSELEEAWCSACFLWCANGFPPHTLWYHTHQAFSYFGGDMSCFCHFLNNLIAHCFMDKKQVCGNVFFFRKLCMQTLIFISSNLISVKTV